MSVCVYIDVYAKSPVLAIERGLGPRWDKHAKAKHEALELDVQLPLAAHDCTLSRDRQTPNHSPWHVSSLICPTKWMP